MGAQHARFLVRRAWLKVECVLHRPRRMVLRHVEGGEIVPLRLYLRSFGNGEAKVGEDLRKLVHYLADRMHRSADALWSGHRKIDFLGGEFSLQPRPLRGLPGGLRLHRNRFTQGMDLRRFRRALAGLHRAQRLEQRSDGTGLTERRYAHGFKSPRLSAAAIRSSMVSVSIMIGASSRARAKLQRRAMARA